MYIRGFFFSGFIFQVVPMLSPTERFSSRVDYYVRSRPKYPAALLRFFQTELDLKPADAIADIGSGTGFLTELFLRNGNPCFAVEPNEPMRAAAEASLGQYPNFHSVNATAESTTLTGASVRFITAGQAFHWFDVEKSASEFHRILKPGGVVALIWNERVNDYSPFMAGYARLLQQYQHQAPMSDGLPEIQQFFGPGGYQFRKFENPQPLDRDGLIDRITSSSYMPLPSHAGYDGLVEAARKLFKAHQVNQTVTIMHETQVFYGNPSGMGVPPMRSPDF
jgi:SAM-dependent methyltransferase